MNKNVQRFWSHEANNIRCVREADYDALRAEMETLKSQPAGVAVPDGWRLVPIEPTELMLARCHLLSRIARAAWIDMLAAAPPPASSGNQPTCDFAQVADSGVRHPVSGEQPQVLLDDDAFVEEFMAWWEADGQLVRSGGGDYERAFAFEAWRHLMPKIVELQTLPAAQDVAGMDLIEAGNPLSNAAYNLAQKPGHVLTAYDCELLGELRKRWDAALAAHRAQLGEQS